MKACGGDREWASSLPSLPRRGCLRSTSAPAGAGEPTQAGTVTTPFEPPTAVPRFETFPWYWAGNPAVITVDNKLKKLRDPIKKALSVWNHAGIDIKWKFKAGGADVKVVKYGNAPCGFGLATTNYNFNGRATDALVQPRDQQQHQEVRLH